MFAPSGLIARRYVFSELSFDEKLRIGEDWDALIRISQSYKIAFVDEPLIIYNDAPIGRMTSKTTDMSVIDLEKRAAVLYKHKEYFGPYWLNFHLARYLLSNIRFIPNKLGRIAYTIKRCGYKPTIAVLYGKVYRALTVRRIYAS